MYTIGDLATKARTAPQVQSNVAWSSASLASRSGHFTLCKKPTLPNEQKAAWTDLVV